MIDPKEDALSHFADWFLNSGEVNKVYTPFKNPLLFIEGVSGIVLYRSKPYQVELFICQPNLVIPEHIDITGEVDKQLEIIAGAEDKLSALRQHYGKKEAKTVL